MYGVFLVADIYLKCGILAGLNDYLADPGLIYADVTKDKFVYYSIASLIV